MLHIFVFVTDQAFGSCAQVPIFHVIPIVFLLHRFAKQAIYKNMFHVIVELTVLENV